MKQIEWHKVLNSKDEIAPNRIKSVYIGSKQLALSHFEGKICAIDNSCPHQGGPLGEGSIENGILRCPWHGWDFHPCTGKAPGFDDGVRAFPVEERVDGIYVGLEAEKPHLTTLSDVMVQTMINWGVDTVFGMVGHSNLGMADAIRRNDQDGELKYIGIRHEGAGAFAASAYGKLTGKPAVCFSIAGPGATNMFTGMWDAKVDRAPLIALTGQVATQVVGTGNFQEVDLVQAFSTVAVFNHRVQRDSRHAELMSLAIKHSLINRDVVHLTLPDEIQELPAGDQKPQSSLGRMRDQRIRPAVENIDSAIAMLEKSKRPVIIMGHGARFHRRQVIAFAEQLKAPVLTTFKGKGLIPDDHPLGAGVLGRSGTPVASWFMNECDLLIVIGASFSNHTGITPKKPTIQIDFDALALSKFHAIDLPLWGEIGETLEEIRLGMNVKTFDARDQRDELKQRWSIWKKEKAKRLGEEHKNGVNAAIVFDALTKFAPANAVMCVDVGNNAYSFGRYFESKAQDFLMSGYLGSIGFALPAGLGAWAATRGTRPVIVVAGDGGFAQYMAELTTSVKYGMNLKVIVLNNNQLGKITKEQRSAGLDKFATDLINPSFADFASSCGAKGLSAGTSESVYRQMEALMAHEGTALLEIQSDPELI